MSTEAPTTLSNRPHPAAAAILWASALILAALLMVQIGRSREPVTSRSPEATLALAMQGLGRGPGGGGGGGVARAGDYTMMTFDAGNDEAVAVLDGRAEEVYFYRIKNLSEFEFLGRENLPALFNTAKRIGPGRK
jgi:hypothetical protein